MTFAVQRAADRAHFDHGWLKTYHSFSFAEYHDPRNQNWGALRVLNDDTVAPGQGFPTHPHRDMEIVTYVLRGQLEHRDSTGSHGVVGPGGAQYMSAGTGVSHSEFNGSMTEPLHFLQMWVLPGKRGAPPAYGQVKFAPAERTNKWLVIASGRPSVPGAVNLTQDASFSVSRLEAAALERTFDDGRLGFLFVARGDVRATALDQDGVGASKESLATGDAVRIAGVRSLSVEGSAEIVLWDVPPI